MNCKNSGRKHRGIKTKQRQGKVRIEKRAARELAGEMRTQPVKTQRLFPEIWNGAVNPWPSSRYAERKIASGGQLNTLELCAGAGGQALGFEQAGISHRALIEIDKHACSSLRLNRPNWEVLETDPSKSDASAFKAIEIVSGGLPCPPFSVAGKQLGREDDHNSGSVMVPPAQTS
jgi:hypothetical protein